MTTDLPGASPVDRPGMRPQDAERAELIARATTMRAEIRQIFDDAAHWNRVHSPWKGKPLDPDPDGKLQRIADGIDRMLDNEATSRTVRFVRDVLANDLHQQATEETIHAVAAKIDSALGLQKPNVRAEPQTTAARTNE